MLSIILFACMTAADVLLATGADFLKLGSFGFGLLDEKNDESDFASLTAVTTTFGSRLTSGFTGAVPATAILFAGGPGFAFPLSRALRFFCFASTRHILSWFDLRKL